MYRGFCWSHEKAKTISVARMERKKFVKEKSKKDFQLLDFGQTCKDKMTGSTADLFPFLVHARCVDSICFHRISTQTLFIRTV